jgi:hypothetical protein
VGLGVDTWAVRQVVSPDGSQVFRLWQAPERALPETAAEVCPANPELGQLPVIDKGGSLVRPDTGEGSLPCCGVVWRKDCGSGGLVAADPLGVRAGRKGGRLPS